MSRDLPGEIWKSVPSDPTLEASSEGRIRIKPWVGLTPKGAPRVYGGVPTYGFWDKKQRRFVYARMGHGTRRVARLVCEAFHGPAPPDKPITLHGDENSRNNRPENLSWGTSKENQNAPIFVEYVTQRPRDSNNRFVKNGPSITDWLHRSSEKEIS